MKANIVLEVKEIYKRFGGVKALDDVSFHLFQGEFLGLVGENGAGKSTLIKILGGALQPDSGYTCLHGQRIELGNPRKAIELGISVIYQELNLVPTISIAKNIFLGSIPTMKFFPIVDHRRLHRDAKQLIANLGVEVDPTITLRDVSIANRQITAICKALNAKSKILILDEPTSSLSEKERDQLFGLLDSLKEKGISVIFTSHNLEEVIALADRIIVLRNGKVVSNRRKVNFGMEILINDMIGKEVNELYPKTKVDVQDSLLEIKDFSDSKAFNNVSLCVRKGEMIGLAGLMGSGRTELLKAIFGARTKKTGQQFINNKEVPIRNCLDAIRAGIGYIPEDRQTEGLILNLLISNNMTLPNLQMISTLGVIIKSKMKELINKWIVHLNIATYNPFKQKANELSGGNQQKTVISKWLASGVKILLLDDPTKGIDVGTKAEIHKLIGDYLKEGNCAVIVSSEIDELISVCDRIYVLKNGRITDCLISNTVEKDKLMRLLLRGDQGQSNNSSKACDRGE